MEVDDETITERWEERAAILEYDAGMTRKNAERLAAISVRRLFGRLPEVVREQARERT
jgi:hypothetical protein